MSYNQRDLRGKARRFISLMMVLGEACDLEEIAVADFYSGFHSQQVAGSIAKLLFI